MPVSMPIRQALRVALKKAAYAKETGNYELQNVARRFIQRNFKNRHDGTMIVIK